MKKWILLFLVSSLAHADRGNMAKPPAAVASAIAQFKKAVQKGSEKEIEALLQFPLLTSRPFEFKRAEDFREKFAYFLDASFKKSVKEAETAELLFYPKGWGFVEDAVWLNAEGKVIALYPQTRKFREMRGKALETELKHVHPSVGKFRHATDCHTKGPRIILFRTEGGERYVAWNPGKAMSDKPNVNLLATSGGYEGSGGNGDFDFETGDITYHYEVNAVCGEDPTTGDRNFDGGGCDDSVQVYRGKGESKKMISDLVCG
jgi:hypothetical protein